MDNSEYKVCEVCGQEKHILEFSKSYPRRCKACVAEHTKMVRERTKQEQNRSKNTEIRSEMQKAREKLATKIANVRAAEERMKLKIKQIQEEKQ